MAGALRRLGLIAAAAVLVSGCGGESDADTGAGDVTGPTAAWVNPDGEEPFVGSLALDPRKPELWLSTNRGLYRVDAHRGGRPRQVTGALRTPQGSGEISAQLVVGFDARGRMLASGHPDAGADLPPVLGLLRSEDRGKTWQSVSQLGTSDFHVLEHAGRTLVAAQYGDAQVLVSRDDGRTWTARTAPAVVIDLAVDPRDAERWAATTVDGVFNTRDGGQTWRPTDTVPHVRLAWARDGTLFRLDPDGAMRRSTDGGLTWKDAGSGGPEQAQALTVAGDARTLYAALPNGEIARSLDAGRSWRPFVPIDAR